MRTVVSGISFGWGKTSLYCQGRASPRAHAACARSRRPAPGAALGPTGSEAAHRAGRLLWRWRFVVAAVVLLLLIAAAPTAAYAHTPHIDVARIRLDGVLGDRSFFFSVVRENLWLSVDGAATWRRLWRGLPYARVRDVALTAGFTADGRAALATDAGLHYTVDHGQTWRPARVPAGLWPAPAQLTLPPGPSPVVSLHAAVDAAEMACLVDGGVLLSDDGGATWRTLSAPFEGRAAAALGDGRGWWLGFDDGRVWRIDRAGATAGPWRLGAPVTALADGGAAGIYAATDGAGAWRLESDGSGSQIGVEDARVTSLAVLDPCPELPAGGLAATTWREGVLIRSFADDRWALRARGLTREAQADHAPFFAPQFRQIAAARTREGGLELFVAGFDGLFRSSDLGRLWRKAPTGVSTEIVAGVAEEGADAAVLSLYGGGVRTVARRKGAGAAGPPSLRGVRTFAAARATQPGGRSEIWVAGHDFIYALGSDGELIRQVQLGAGEDADASSLLKLRRRLLRPVKQAVAGLPASLRDPIRAAVVARGGLPGLKIRVAGFGSQFAVPGDFERAGVAFVSTWRHGLFRTDDHGRTFRRIWSPEDGAALHDIAVLPDVAESGVVYAATETGLRASQDGGATWGQPQIDASVLRVAAAPGPDGRPLLFAATWSGLLRREVADDGGDAGGWRAVLDCPGAHAVTEIALAPDFAQSGIALINVAGRGLHRSTDWGVSFAPCRNGVDGLPPECGQLVSFPDSARTVAFSPAFESDGVVWAAGGTTVRRSHDRGLSWRPVAAGEHAEATAPEDDGRSADVL